MATIIKRYPNRKLYDTVEKQYITLDRIADMIRDGLEVHVVDNATGEDLTAVTLTQVLFEMEKKQSGFFPKSLLTGLVQSGGTTLEAVRRTLTMPLDLARHVDDEIEHRLEWMVAENEIGFEESRQLLEKLLTAGRRKEKDKEKAPSTVLERVVGRFLDERDIPSTQEVERLRSQVDLLAQMIDGLSPSEATTLPASEALDTPKRSKPRKKNMITMGN